MRTTPVLGVVLCFGVALTLLSGSGFAAGVFGESPADDPTVETLGDLSDESDVKSEESGGNGGISGFVDGTQGLPGLVISVTNTITTFFGAVALLPLTLTRLGFPNYFAVPVGGLAQIVAFIGIAQFVSGRELL